MNAGKEVIHPSNALNARQPHVVTAINAMLVPIVKRRSVATARVSSRTVAVREKANSRLSSIDPH